jgi:hypothetical protein
MQSVSVAAIVVVSLFVNGQQVALPNPPFVYDGRVYAPLRGLLEKMGATVKWDGPTQTATVTHGQTTVVLKVGDRTTAVNGQPKTLDSGPMLMQGVVYIPLRAAVDIFGATIEWDAARRAAGIRFDDARAPVPVTVAMIESDPSRYELTPVVLSGEYRGWMPDPFSPATRHGPPETRSDWVLRDDTGDIYCAPVAGAESELPLLPLSGVGRRIRVEGVAAIARRGFAYVRPKSVTLVTGREGLTRSLAVDKQLYESPAGPHGKGEIVHMTLTLANPFDAAVEIPAGAEPEAALATRPVEFVVADAKGVVVWRSSAGPGARTLSAPASLTPGEKKEFEASWDQTSNWPLAAGGSASGPGRPVRTPGNYRISARVGGLTACPVIVRIAQSAKP